MPRAFEPCGLKFGGLCKEDPHCKAADTGTKNMLDASRATASPSEGLFWRGVVVVVVVVVVLLFFF
eukprot:4113126-Pyramimonas_sp.AAC.1